MKIRVGGNSKKGSIPCTLTIKNFCTKPKIHSIEVKSLISQRVLYG